MLVYYVNLLLILGLAYPLCVRKPSRMKSLIYILITFGFMLLLSSARVGIGNDFDAYAEIYIQISQTSWADLSKIYMEKGYVLLCKILSCLRINVTGFYYVMAVLCLAPPAWFIYRYSPNVWLSVWLYVTLTFFYGTMNFIRQNLAVAVLLLGYPLLRRKKPWAAACYALVILAAMLLHKSAVVMLPVLLLCYLPLNLWIAFGYTALTGVLYLTSDVLIDFFLVTVCPRIPALHQYALYKGSIFFELGFGTNFLILPALVLGVALLFKRRTEALYPDAPILNNMLLINMVIWIFITKHFILERFSLNVYIYALIALPMAVESLHPSQESSAEYPRIKKKTGRLDFKALARSWRGYLRYWGVVGVILAASFGYHLFGMYDGGLNADGQMGFHGVFPYRSWIGWLNRLP